MTQSEDDLQRDLYQFNKIVKKFNMIYFFTSLIHYVGTKIYGKKLTVEFTKESLSNNYIRCVNKTRDYNNRHNAGNRRNKNLRNTYLRRGCQVENINGWMKNEE